MPMNPSRPLYGHIKYELWNSEPFFLTLWIRKRLEPHFADIISCWHFYLLGILQNLQFLILIPDRRALKCWGEAESQRWTCFCTFGCTSSSEGAYLWIDGSLGRVRPLWLFPPNFSFWTETSLPWSGLRRLKLDLCMWKQQQGIGPVVEAATRPPGGCELAVAENSWPWLVRGMGIRLRTSPHRHRTLPCNWELT